MILITTISTTIEKAEVIDFYKEMLSNQSSNFWALIIFFLSITTVLIGTTWLWNFVIAKKQIKSEVEEQIKDIEKSLDTKYNEILKEEVGRIEKALEYRHLQSEAVQRMSLAIQSFKERNFTSAIAFFSLALGKYIMLMRKKELGNV